jgi:hypothetical protein
MPTSELPAARARRAKRGRPPALAGRLVARAMAPCGNVGDCAPGSHGPGSGGNGPRGVNSSWGVGMAGGDVGGAGQCEQTGVADGLSVQ